MKKKVKLLPRSAVFLQMILTRKGGAHRDRRRESRRKHREPEDD
jgi:hypothetical protein